ncbi:MAG: hemolysin III family protein [Bacteroidetes bacterium]|nr:hemolysin III family protein [Bacteroidota bacterium]MCB0852474.1 hemolysin III family protein [Bacteroidota bacterium]
MDYPSIKEEIANSITHGFGVLLSFIGIPIMVSYAVFKGTPQHVWAVSIFSATLLMLYIFSTVYHSIQQPSAKRVLRIFDHISIYFLIAGSYTPFILFFMNRTSGYVFLGLIWAIALAGTIFKVFFTGKFNLISTILYVAMGWMVLFIAKPIFSAMSFEGILWLAIGGGAYTLGVVFYLWKNLRYNHAIWHVFVLTGSISHYISVLYSMDYVVGNISL